MFCPGFQKGRGPSEKGTINVVNGRKGAQLMWCTEENIFIGLSKISQGVIGTKSNTVSVTNGKTLAKAITDIKF